MFLKLFPRYAGRARRGATVAGDNLRGTAVVVENAPKSLSRHDGASVIRACRQRCDELVAETLVVPFCVIVHYVFGYRCAQVSLTERYSKQRKHLFRTCTTARSRVATLDGGSTTKSRRTNHGAEERRNLQLPSIDGEAVEQAVSTGAAKILLAAASAWMRRVP